MGNNIEPAQKLTRKNIFSPFDSLDYKIIQQLRRNARASASEIARTVDVNERTVRKRIERLMALGVGRLTLVVEPCMFGYGLSVDIFVQIKTEHEEDILKQLLNMPHISYLAYGQGTNDISIEARFKTNEELHEFIRLTLPAIPGITVTDYALVPRILRNIDEWMPPPEDFGIQME